MSDFPSYLLLLFFSQLQFSLVQLKRTQIWFSFSCPLNFHKIKRKSTIFFRITMVVIVPGETVTLKMQNSLFMREETSGINSTLASSMSNRSYGKIIFKKTRDSDYQCSSLTFQ